MLDIKQRKYNIEIKHKDGTETTGNVSRMEGPGVDQFTAVEALLKLLYEGNLNKTLIKEIKIKLISDEDASPEINNESRASASFVNKILEGTLGFGKLGEKDKEKYIKDLIDSLFK